MGGILRQSYTRIFISCPYILFDDEETYILCHDTRYQNTNLLNRMVVHLCGLGLHILYGSLSILRKIYLCRSFFDINVAEHYIKSKYYVKYAFQLYRFCWFGYRQIYLTRQVILTNKKLMKILLLQYLDNILQSRQMKHTCIN